MSSSSFAEARPSVTSVTPPLSLSSSRSTDVKPTYARRSTSFSSRITHFSIFLFLLSVASQPSTRLVFFFACAHGLGERDVVVQYRNFGTGRLPPFEALPGNIKNGNARLFLR